MEETACGLSDHFMRDSIASGSFSSARRTVSSDTGAPICSVILAICAAAPRAIEVDLGIITEGSNDGQQGITFIWCQHFLNVGLAIE